MDRYRHRSFSRFAIAATLGLAACAALSFSCSSPILGSGPGAELTLRFELAADFTSVQAANPSARFLLPEMRSLSLEVRSLDPFTAANIDMAIPVSWDPATGWVSATTVIGVPPDTPLAITVSGLDGSGTAISRAYAEFLVPSDAAAAPLTLVLMPTAAFPSMLELVPDNLSLAQTIPARSSLVCKFLPGSLTGAPAFAAWSHPAAAGLEVSLRLADGTRIPFIPRGDGSGVDFTTPSSLEHFFIVYNPGAGTVNLGSLLAAPAGSSYVPTVTMTDLTRTLGDAPFAIKPASPSGGAFAFTSSNTAVATIDPVTGLVTMVSSGTTTIGASQAAWGFWDASVAAGTCVLTVAPAGAAVSPTFGTWGPFTLTYGDAPYTLPALVTNSPGAVTYSSDNSAVATVSGDTVTIVGAGTATITASQAAALPDYLAGTKTATLTVNKGTPTLSSFPDLTKTWGDPDFTLSQPIISSMPASTGTWSYSLISGPLTVNAATGDVGIISAGVAVVRATLSSDANWNGAFIESTVTVSKAVTAIGGVPATASKVYGDPGFSVGTPASSNSQPFGYSTSDAAVVTCDGSGNVTVTGAGTATVWVTQPADLNYEATSFGCTVTVDKATPVISHMSPVGQSFSLGSFQLTPTSTNTDSAVFGYASTDILTATVNGTGLVSFVKTGSVLIQVSQAGTANFYAASPIMVNVPIISSPPAVTTLPASAITSTDAMLNSDVVNKGGDATVTVYFWYGTSPGPVGTGVQTAATPGFPGGAFAVNVPGLTSLTTYYFVAVVVNGTGTPVYGPELSFMTP